MSLYAPAARPQLAEMIATLHRRGERYLRLKFGLPLYKDESDREHAALLDAVRRARRPRCTLAGDRASARHRRVCFTVS